MIIDDNGNYYHIPTEWMQKHDARIRTDAILKCLEIIARETHNEALYDCIKKQLEGYKNE